MMIATLFSICATEMKWEDLIPRLRNHSSVVVTGPQRSGTRIGSHVIAEELDKRYVDEVDFGIHDFRKAFEESKKGGVVIHAPALAHCAHEFDCAVVFMIRDVADIIASQERIDWSETAELAKYKAHSGPVAELKYRNWFERQRSRCKHPYELEYESLSTHHLWVPKEERASFSAHQWSLETCGR